MAAGTNVHVLENETVRFGGVTFACCTLWTDFAINGDAYRGMLVAGERMNDFRKIRISNYERRFLPRHALTRHVKSWAFLDAEMRKPREHGDGLAIVSHHCPIPDPGESGNDPTLDPAYRSDLRRLMVSAPDDGRGALRPADIWIYAHTHESFDAVVGATRVVSNARATARGRRTNAPGTIRTSTKNSSSRSERTPPWTPTARSTLRPIPCPP
ncbi:hypothetical protein [Bradyrhizobium sp. RDM4]|uniref:hypothetical protein n=1 Tax=Bradyrhizobium sp. RDM4 TaxID=3378765 RepID=UPI0038FCB47C